MLRASATLVVAGPSHALATGKFGEVGGEWEFRAEDAREGEGMVVSICAELANAGSSGMGRADLWQRVVSRGPSRGLGGQVQWG